MNENHTLEQALTALAQAQSVATLVAIQLDHHRFVPALWVVVELLETTTALLESHEEPQS